MDELVLKWLPVVSPVVSLLLAWGFWSLKQELTPREEFEHLKDRLEKLEAQVGALPDRQALERMSVRIESIHGDVRELAGKLNSMADNVRLLIKNELGVR